MTLRIAQVRRRPAWPTAAVVLGAAWLALGSAALALSARLGRPVIVCPFRLLTGLPCPFCGGGRALTAAAEGDLLAAWLFNPLLVTVCAAFGVLLFVRVVWGRAMRLEMSRRENRAFWLAGAGLLAANWAYVLAFVG